MSGEFRESRCTLPIHLHPSRLANVREGVEEHINALLMKYVDELGGVLLSYSDLSLSVDESINPLHCGTIFQERSYIHFSVEIKALTWRCAAGERYTGVVNAVAGDHLSVLVHGIFSATIPLSPAHAPSGWRWEAERERWVDQNLYKGEEETSAVKGEDGSDEEGDEAAEATATATPGKKLSKKELKKLERRKLRAVMLAATGRGGPAAVKAPPTGVVARGVHVRFECVSVQHTDEYIKLTGSLTSKNVSATEPLGLTGAFTALAPLEGADSAATNAQEGEEAADASLVDMDAIAAVTAPVAGAAAAAAAAAVPSPAAAVAAAPASSKKALSAAQQERMAKKKAKLAERMAAKGADGDADAPSSDSVVATPAKKQKVSNSNDEVVTEKKKTKKKDKLKPES